jgi:gamma-glutamyltranspeptidase/glutathione hydrolase
MTMIKRSLLVLLALLSSLSRPPLFSQALIPKEAKNGMVVSTQGVASEAGLEILKRGGNAVDAAITTAFVLAVVYPSCGNIGGEGFLLYHGSDGRVDAIDFRAKAPAAVTPLPAYSLMMRVQDGGNLRSRDCVLPTARWPSEFPAPWPGWPWPIANTAVGLGRS